MDLIYDSVFYFKGFGTVFYDCMGEMGGISFRLASVYGLKEICELSSSSSNLKIFSFFCKALTGF
jgi:hypothetical protein